MNPFPCAFQGLNFGFSIFFVVSLNYRLMKIGSTNTKSEFRASMMEFFVMIVNSTGKSSILDVTGVLGYIIVINRL